MRDGFHKATTQRSSGCSLYRDASDAFTTRARARICTLAAPARFRPGRRLPRWRRWSAHRPPAGYCARRPAAGSGTLKAPSTLRRRARADGHRALAWRGPAADQRLDRDWLFRVAAPARAPVPPPGCSGGAKAGSGAAAPARSGRCPPAGPAGPRQPMGEARHQIQPVGMLERQDGAAAVFVIGEDGAGADRRLAAWPGRRRSASPRPASTGERQAAAGAHGPSRKAILPQQAAQKPGRRPAARGRRCRAAETAGRAAIFQFSPMPLI